MRHWVKYATVLRTSPAVAVAYEAEDYFAQMGGYGVDESYRAPSAFFAKRLHADPRLLAYDRYLQGRVSRPYQILSIASGRCVNELWLM